MIRIDLDTDIGMNLNSSDWLEMNSYPILLPGPFNHLNTTHNIKNLFLSPEQVKFTKKFTEKIIIHLIQYNHTFLRKNNTTHKMFYVGHVSNRKEVFKLQSRMI